METTGKVRGPSSLSFTFIVTTTSLAFVVSQLDVSIVNIALPSIAQAFGAGISALQWVADAYTIAFAACMLSAGGMSDRYGSGHVFRFGLLVFGLASAGCGWAWNTWSLIGFRALQGLGAATMIPSSLSILNHAFADSPNQRSSAVALWTMAGGISIAAGPVLGGLLLHISNWRMIFLVNIPICLAGFILSYRLPENEKHPGKGLDLPGQITWMLSLTALIAAVIEWHEFGFRSPLILGALLFSILLIAVFIRIERRAQSPILPLDLFRSPVFNTLLLLGISVNLAYYGSVFVLSIYLQDALHYSSLHAGLAFLPLTGSFVISNIISGKLMEKYGIRVPLFIGALIAMTGFACLLIAHQDTPYWQLFLPFLLIPLGMGSAVPAMTTGILSSVPRSRSGTASAVLNTTRQAAGATGVALFGALAAGKPDSIITAVRISGLLSAACIGIAAIFLYRYIWKNNERSIPAKP